MSYILDALKKSDKQRRKDRVPDLQTIQEINTHPRAKKRPMWPYLLVTILLINIGMLAVWLRPWQSEKQNIIPQPTPLAPPHTSMEDSQQKQAAPAPPHASPAPPRPTGINPPITRPVAQETPPKLDTVAKSRPTPSMPKPGQSRHVAKKPASPKSNSKPLSSEPQIIESTPPVEQLAKAPQDDSTTDELMEQPTVAEQELTKAEPPPANPVADAAQLANVQAVPQAPKQIASIPPPRRTQPDTMPNRSSEPQVIDRLQLPASVQQDIPEIRISAHVYSKKPASRLVSINGRVMREGHTLPPGLKLDEITPDGVIFSYSGYRFYVGVF